MPCADITETLELTLDFDERLLDFALNKRSCGQTVGGDALLPFVKHLTIDTLRDGFLEQFVPDLDQYSEIDEFLLQKQFFALQAAIAVYRGEASGAAGRLFTMVGVTFDAAGATIGGDVAIDALVEEIKACKGCGTSKGKRLLPVAEPKPV